MVDMLKTIEPRSDQMNADDLIGGPRTVTITAVRATDAADQPIAVSFAGDENKPFKPCKSMRRVMVHVWGADAKLYIGRSMTLYCDPGVQFGGMKVGGIRISHMSHMDKPQTMALTATRAKRAPFTVHPLTAAEPAAVDIDALEAMFDAVTDQASFDAAETARRAAWPKLDNASKAAMKTASDAAKARIATPTDSPTQPEGTM